MLKAWGETMIRCIKICTFAVVLLLLPVKLQAQVIPASLQATGTTYPDSSEGLQKQLQDTLEALKSKDTAAETALIRTLLMPAGSTWFRDEFGPAFGPRLEAAYQKALPTLEQDIRIIYEGNVQRGWLKPKIFRYADAASVDSPTDNFLNCMDDVVALYQTAFNGERTGYLGALKLDEPGKMRPVAGDLDGYYVYANGSFRFVPQRILFMLPKERPVRIHLDMNVMQSKIINKTEWTYPTEAIKQHIKGKVIIRLVLDTSGRIKEISPLEGPAILSNTVLQAVKQWSFEPTTLDAEPVEVEMNLETTFQ